MDQSTRAVRLARWTSIVRQCQSRPENQTISQWLAERGINENTYFYWQWRVRRQAYHELQNSSELPVCQEAGDVSFFEIPVAQGSGASVAQTFHADAELEAGSLKVLPMQAFQAAASVLMHRLPHSAKPHSRILPQRGINITIRLSNSVSPELLAGIMEAVRHAR